MPAIGTTMAARSARRNASLSGSRALSRSAARRNTSEQAPLRAL
jgi:hypothetical protein